MAAGNVLAHEIVDSVEPARPNRKGLDRRPARRQLIETGEIQIGVQRLGERTWDRSRRHVQRMRRRSFSAQARALLDAEAMLLVYNHQSQAFEIHAFGE